MSGLLTLKFTTFSNLLHSHDMESELFAYSRSSKHLSGRAHMLKPSLRRWRKPPPMLVFMLAVMLPAAALIAVSASYLRHIQRGKMLEAAIRLDYEHTLKIAEKRIIERAYDSSERVSANFPDVDNPEELDTFLTTHPEIAHAFIWSGKGNFDFDRSPPA